MFSFLSFSYYLVAFIVFHLLDMLIRICKSHTGEKLSSAILLYTVFIYWDSWIFKNKYAFSMFSNLS